MFHMGDLVWIKEGEVSSFKGWGLVVGTKKTVLADGSTMIDLVVFGAGRKITISSGGVRKFSFMNSHIGGRDLL
jgi:hypothetical protein